MDKLFRLAAESMLGIYGKDGSLLRCGMESEPVRISPLFSSRIARENGGTKIESDGNVILSGCRGIPHVHQDRLLAWDQEWSILSVSEICDGIYELELKR